MQDTLPHRKITTCNNITLTQLSKKEQRKGEHGWCTRDGLPVCFETLVQTSLSTRTQPKTDDSPYSPSIRLCTFSKKTFHHCLNRISPSKRCPFMHFLNAVIGLIYRCVWFYTTSAPRCGQKRWRNVARSVSHRGLLMTVIQRQEGLENGRGLICFSEAEHQPLSSPGLFAFYVQLFRWKKNSPGKGWNR